jgi:hypothetical protein
VERSAPLSAALEIDPSRVRCVKISSWASSEVLSKLTEVLRRAADCLALSPPTGHGAERGACPKGGAGVSLRSALESAAVRDFLGLSSPCLPFLLLGEVWEGMMLSTNVGCATSDMLFLLILREVWPLVMLVPKSCIFLTDLLNLRLREVLREGSSIELFIGTFDVVVVDDAVETPLNCDKKLGVRPKVVCEFATGRSSCLLLDL